MTTPTLVTAIHEAGHAIARLVNDPGPGIHYIAVTNQPADRLGICNFGDRWIPGVIYPANILHLGRRAAHLDVIEALAGPAAELRQRWRDWAAVELEGLNLGGECIHGAVEAGSDLGFVRPRIEWLHPDDAEDHFQNYWSEAVELVRRHWRAVDAFGRLLLDRGRIDGNEVYEWWRDRSTLAA